MHALTSILVATDFSAPSRHAADRAARLAHETGAQMTRDARGLQPRG